MKFSIKDLFSKSDQILLKLWIWSHLLKKSLMENFIFVQLWLIYGQISNKGRILKDGAYLRTTFIRRNS